MRNSSSALFWLLFITFSVGSHECKADAPGSGDCLQYPVYDDGTNTLYLANHYASQGQGGCVDPQEVFVWLPSDIAQATPEDCGTCNDRDKGGRGLKDEVPTYKIHKPLHHFKDDVSTKRKTKKTSKDWSPHDGTSVAQIEWVRILTEDDTEIKVKLYVFVFDYKKGGHDDTKLIQRSVRVGFEVNDFPSNVKDTDLLTPTGWSGTKATQFACDVVPNLTEAEIDAPYTVVTQTAVFKKPKKK